MNYNRYINKNLLYFQKTILRINIFHFHLNIVPKISIISTAVA